MQKLRELIIKFDVRRFVKYGLVGVLNTVIDFAAFYVLNSLMGMDMVPAQVISFLVAIVNSFLFNRRWTFEKDGSTNKGEVLRYCLGKAGYLLCNLLLLKFFTWLLPISAFAAKFPTVVILIFFNYLYDKIIVFLIRGRE